MRLQRVAPAALAVVCLGGAVVLAVQNLSEASYAAGGAAALFAMLAILATRRGAGQADVGIVMTGARARPAPTKPQGPQPVTRRPPPQLLEWPTRLDAGSVVGERPDQRQ